MQRASELSPLVAESFRSSPSSILASRFRWSVLLSPLLVVSGAALLFTLAYVMQHDSLRSSVKNLKGTASTNSERPEDEFFCGITNHETGYIKLPNKDDHHYFYWFVESRSDPQSDPLVLWLTGGPGCSSMTAILAENGPCLVLPDLSTKINEYSWNQQANVIWLDQPTGVGFSYGQYDSEDINVADNIYWFLQEFFRKHPNLINREFFVTGESYGGHYIPAAASHILKANMLRHLHSNAIYINLAGIAVGNGLTDPEVQYQHIVDMAYNSYNVSLLDKQTIDGMRKAELVCRELIVQCQHEKSKCLDALSFCSETLEAPFFQSGRNPYDIREPCTEDNVMKCFHFEHIEDYLNTPSVLDKIGVNLNKLISWRECDATVGAQFAFDQMVSSTNEVEFLLDAGVRVLIYAGDADLMCNWAGNEAWVMALDWSGKAEYNSVPNRPLVTSEMKNAGRVRSFENLAFVRVFNSGHIVPMDQPAVSLELINKFLQNKNL
ncbi:serine protease family [Plasmopara halstedii]|uniref:Carboxypeptidase n=1 Tax=Plasmopara halstedii TaxID=4781 RepID=A0A0P1B101_PLAHL|nr:serine protease family [Plasmopara halstedii]CEG48354.1 serine protease family [Plasmopara halstedii]|eukprot:XP_024584723.1 serine protease family [Plasmopara halstedii]